MRSRENKRKKARKGMRKRERELRGLGGEGRKRGPRRAGRKRENSRRGHQRHGTRGMGGGSGRTTRRRVRGTAPGSPRRPAMTKAKGPRPVEGTGRRRPPLSPPLPLPLSPPLPIPPPTPHHTNIDTKARRTGGEAGAGTALPASAVRVAPRMTPETAFRDFDIVSVRGLRGKAAAQRGWRLQRQANRAQTIAPGTARARGRGADASGGSDRVPCSSGTKQSSRSG